MDKTTQGWINGLAGMIIFSGSLPATRVAVAGFDPVFLTVARASIAGVLAAICLLAFKVEKPQREDAVSLFITAIGVVVGFPLFTALALQYVTASHSIVFIALLPLMTALFGVLRAGEKPSKTFWVFSCLGSALVAGFAVYSDATVSLVGDAFMLAAIVICGLGYAEGAKLSRKHGGWQVISWALVVSLPVMLLLALFLMPSSFNNIQTSAWVGLVYVSLFSMFIGFIFWYRGLAMGGIASVGQLQLLQPFIGMALAALFLNENISFAMMATSLLVVLCVVGARRFA